MRTFFIIIETADTPFYPPLCALESTKKPSAKQFYTNFYISKKKKKKKNLAMQAAKGMGSAANLRLERRKRMDSDSSQLRLRLASVASNPKMFDLVDKALEVNHRKHFLRKYDAELAALEPDDDEARPGGAPALVSTTAEFRRSQGRSVFLLYAVIAFFHALKTWPRPYHYFYCFFFFFFFCFFWWEGFHYS
jgi:hypothetical protein